MTYANIEAAIVVAGLVAIGLGLLLIVRAIVGFQQASARHDEAWRKWTLFLD